MIFEGKKKILGHVYLHCNLLASPRRITSRKPCPTLSTGKPSSNTVTVVFRRKNHMIIKKGKGDARKNLGSSLKKQVVGRIMLLGATFERQAKMIVIIPFSLSSLMWIKGFACAHRN